jgi:hypothetical protein
VREVRDGDSVWRISAYLSSQKSVEAVGVVKIIPSILSTSIRALDVDVLGVDGRSTT